MGHTVLCVLNQIYDQMNTVTLEVCTVAVIPAESLPVMDTNTSPNA